MWQFCANYKDGAEAPPRNKKEGKYEENRLFMEKQFIFASINYVLYLPDRQIELFRQAVIGYSVKKSALQDFSVSVRVSTDDPFIDQSINLRT